MAITSNIDQIIKDPDATVIRVTYTDGALVKVQKEYRLTTFDLETFKGIVRNDIAQLSAVDTVTQKLVSGPFDPAAALPSVGNLAKAKFVADLLLLRQMEKAIALTFKTVDDLDYKAQVTLVKSEFVNPDYLPLL